jgi:acyl-CoA thioester hydrolase
MTRKREAIDRPRALGEYPIVVRLPILWGDLDANGHVNNVIYLKWFEAARAVYAERVGVEIVAREQGVGGVLASLECKYLRPLDYPGEILSAVRMARVSVGSLTLEGQIADARTGVPVADTTCDVVLFDLATNVPVPVPEQIRAAIEKLEGKSFPLR